jgi:hypothetical protein
VPAGTEFTEAGITNVDEGRAVDWSTWTGDAIALIAVLISALSARQSRASKRVADDARWNAEAASRSMDISMQKMAESLATLATRPLRVAQRLSSRPKPIDRRSRSRQPVARATDCGT